MRQKNLTEMPALFSMGADMSNFLLFSKDIPREEFLKNVFSILHNWEIEWK